MGRPVEWVGLPSPWADPGIQVMQATGQLTEADRVNLRKMESRRQRTGFCRVTGITVREFGVADGFTRNYRFGPTPESYVQEMEPEDIERLMRVHDLHKQAFRVLDEIVVVRR